MVDAQVTWVGPGWRLIGETSNSPAIILDSMEPGAGTHSGPTPMELVIIGLAGCTAMDIITVMAKRREPMTGLQVKVHGDRATEHPKVYNKIHIEYIAYGQGINPASLEKAIELSEGKYCSVSAMLNKTAEITSSYRIEPGPNPNEPGGDVPVRS